MNPIKNEENIKKENESNMNINKNVFQARNINEELEMLVRTDEEFAKFKGYID